MKIKLLLFGITTDLLGTSFLELEVTKHCTIACLKTKLIIEYPQLKNLHSYAFAVNETYASDVTELHPFDEVAIIPPVSGG